MSPAAAARTLRPPIGRRVERRGDRLNRCRAFAEEGSSMTTSRVLTWIAIPTAALIMAADCGPVAVAADLFPLGTDASSVDLSGAPGAVPYEDGRAIPRIGARPAGVSGPLELGGV